MLNYWEKYKGFGKNLINFKPEEKIGRTTT